MIIIRRRFGKWAVFLLGVCGVGLGCSLGSGASLPTPTAIPVLAVTVTPTPTDIPSEANTDSASVSSPAAAETPSTEEVAPASEPINTPAPPAATTPPQPTTSAVQTASGGKIVGVFHANEEDLPALASYGVNTVLVLLKPDQAVSYLETAEQVGIHVIASLVPRQHMIDRTCATQAGSREEARSCPFDPEAFRTALERYRSLNLSRFAGTSFYTHMMLDEPFDSTDWGGGIPDEDLRQASAYSKEILGDIPTAVNAGYVPPTMGAGLVDVVSSTFYANKEARFGSVEAYLSDQMNNLASVRSNQPDLQYIIILQAVGGDQFGSFPTVADMEAKAVYACQQPSVNGVLWWAWHQRTPEDFSTTVNGPNGQSYIEMLGRIAQACGN